ncbi:MAG: ABC transporter permease subunit [Planctomycetota bacterium]
MRDLIPFDVSALGLAEYAWLFLALGGLSLLAPPKRPRWLGALLVGLVLATAGFMAAWLGVPEGSAEPSWGTGILFVLFGVAVMLLGSLRVPLQKTLGGKTLAGVWLAALVLISLSLRPFGLGPVDDFEAWVYLASVGFFLAALLDTAGIVRRLLNRAWWGLVPAFSLFVWMADPFALGIGVNVLFATLYLMTLGVSTQGPELRLYVKRRLIGTPIVLLVLLTISFFLIRAAPGGPFDAEKALDAATQAAIDKKYGQDLPLPEQYLKFIGELVWKGDMGPSYKQKDRTVNEIIGNHIGTSAVLGGAALFLALLIGLTTGLISGIKRNSIFDYTSMSAAMIGLALPTFVVGPMLVLVFAMKLDWVPVTGWGSFRELILPAITLALPFAARVARLTRAGMLEVVHQDYIRTARAKGLSERVIVLRHTLKGALTPVVSFLGPAVAQMLTGSLVVEMIFGVPGMGKEFVNSAINRDYTLVLGLVLMFGVLLIFFTLLVDILYAFLDPRIRHA